MALPEIVVRRVCDSMNLEYDDHLSIISHLCNRIKYLESIAAHAEAFATIHCPGFGEAEFKKMTASDWQKSDLHWMAMLRMIERMKQEMPVVSESPLVYRMSEMHFDGV